MNQFEHRLRRLEQYLDQIDGDTTNNVDALHKRVAKLESALEKHEKNNTTLRDYEKLCEYMI